MPCLTNVHESSASGIILSGFWMFLAYSLLDTLVWFVMYYLRKKKHNSKKRRDWNIEHLNCIMNLRYNCNCTSYLHKIFVTCVHTNRVLISRIVCFSNVPDIAFNYHYWGCIRRREFSHSATVKHWHVFISIWIILYLCDWKKFKT